MAFIPIFITFTVFAVCQCNENPQVTTPLGEVRGYTATSFGGRTYSAFEGIPFATPPIGERRFEAPEPVQPWSGIWNATFTTQCLQTSMKTFTFPAMQIDEDCLHINVYVPREVPTAEEKLDVIVHIHGGAYMYCSGHLYAQPQYLMDHDIIFVTFNYRLGIFGFLSTEDDVVPGNNGLKDQVMALKWVQKNIASFGGNPDSVTITGMSAGGSAVHFHYLSEMSRGLFHRGISHSGVTLNPWSIQDQPLKKAKILAEAVGCPTSPSRSLVQCLKQRPHQHLLAQVSLYFGFLDLPLAPFAPVVEKGSKPFLEGDPYYLLTKGKVLDLPWLVSNTAHEGVLPTMFFMNDLATIDEKWEDLAAYILDYDHTLPKSSWKTVAKKIKEFYLGKDQKINQENLSKLVQMSTDRIFQVGAETAVREQAKVTKSPVYYYILSYLGDNNQLGMVGHGDDAKYIFSSSSYANVSLTSNELKMKDILINIWVSFAKTGTPSIEGVNWKPTEYDKLTYLNISGYEPERFELKTVKELTPRDFWKSLGLQESENLILSKDEL